MNKLITTNNGGFPLKLDDFRFIDEANRTSLKAIMSAFGVDNMTVILLSGCTRSVATGTVTISEGYISIGGEICYVPSHSYSAPTSSQKEYWVINTAFDNAGLKSFQDTNQHDTYQVRTGKVTVSSSVPVGHTEYQLAQSIFDVINSKADTLPIGTITLWYGDVNNIPFGYVLCDGQNGTPDMRGRFAVGYNPQDGDFSTIGNTGGTKEHVLSSAELPPHQHNMGVATTDSGNTNEFEAIVIPTATQGYHDYDPIDVSGNTGVNNGGGGDPHNNLPPYLVLAYIMKIQTNTPYSPSNPSGNQNS